ncbi:acyltransferase family protein [Flavimaribacter sediminis]|nr:acyltransferase family protein [Flavimaribacter sediminis]
MAMTGGLSRKERAEESYIHLDAGRIGWVDYLKGFSILLVVMMHSVLGVEEAMGSEGWMHVFVQTAQPFRMPAFFMVAGLFLMRSIDRPLDRYIDTKVVHFVYFYLLWLTIQFAFKAPGMALEGGLAAPPIAWLTALVQPFGTLWFIYVLPIFFLVTRALRRLPAAAVAIAALVLQMLPVHTGLVVIDEFASYYVWFFIGYAYADHIFRLADLMRTRLPASLAFSAIALATIWFFTEWTPWTSIAASHWPGVSFVLGLAGAAALIAICAALDRFHLARAIRWCGAHSIVIYLAFFLPMAASRVILVRSGLIDNAGAVSLLVWIAAVIGPAVLFLLVETSGYGRFLFERPGWARLTPSGRQARP